MNGAEQFFYEHAGWSYDREKETSDQGRVRCARALAEAETLCAREGWFVKWDHDWIPWDGDEPYDGPLWEAVLYDRTSNVLASLGSIACKGQASDYGRVIDAELALDALG
jgi:hypothetical protein